MGRGQRDNRASGRGLLFGPRRERPTLWAQPQEVERGQQEVARLLDGGNLTEICNVLDFHDEVDPSMAPHLAQLVSGLRGQIERGQLGDLEQSRLLGLVARKFSEDGSCPALEPLAPGLIAAGLAHDRPEDHRAILALALGGHESHPLAQEARTQIGQLAPTDLRRADYERLSPILDQLMEGLDGHEGERAEALGQELDAIRGQWPPQYWGKQLKQKLYAGDSALLASAEDWLRRGWGQLDYGPELAAAAPEVRAGLSQALADRLNSPGEILNSGVGLGAVLEWYNLPRPDAEESKALNEARAELVRQFADDKINRPDGAEERSIERHQQLLAGAMTKQALLDPDGFCDRLGLAGVDHQNMRQQLHQLLQQRRLRRDRPLSETIGETELYPAILAGFEASAKPGRPFCDNFSGAVFFQQLLEQAKAKVSVADEAEDR